MKALLAILLCGSAAYGQAILIVDKAITSGTSTTSVTATTAAMASGDTIVVGCGSETNTTIAVADNHNSSYTSRVATFSGSLGTSVAIEDVSNTYTGSVTITCTAGASANMALSYMVLRYVTAFDVAGSAANSNTFNFTTTGSYDSVFAFGNPLSTAVGSGYTQIGVVAPNRYWMSEYQQGVGAGSTPVNWAASWSSATIAGVAYKGNNPPPTCNAGWPTYSFSHPQIPNGGYIGNTYRAGTSVTLNGTGSSAAPGQSITSYTWQELTSLAFHKQVQQGASWSSHVVASPTVTGLTAGPWDLELTVQQTDGQKSSCIIYDGVVATDANGATSLGSSPLGQAIQTVIQTPVANGQDKWPFRDSVSYAALLNQAATYDAMGVNPTYWSDTWDTPSAGTVSVSCSGTTCAVTGTGTLAFDQYLCGGTGNTSFVTNNPPYLFLLWYQTGRTLPNGQPETGRMEALKGGCGLYGGGGNTATQMWFGFNSGSVEGWGSYLGPTANVFGGTPPNYLFPAQPSNLNYSIVQYSGLYPGTAWYQSAEPYYYDPGMSFYAAYYRTGFDVYLVWARKVEDRVFHNPSLDMGNAPAVGNVTTCQVDVACYELSFGGMLVRAYDIDYVDTPNTTNNNMTMWGSLEHLYIDFQIRLGLLNSGAGTVDGRLTGGALYALSLGALLDNANTITGFQYSQATQCYQSNCNPGGYMPLPTSTMTWNQFCRTLIHWALWQGGSSGTNPPPVFSNYQNGLWKATEDTTEHAWLCSWACGYPYGLSSDYAAFGSSMGGYGNASGTTFTVTSGLSFGVLAGATITINGTGYTVASVSAGGTPITLTTSAGTQNGVAWSSNVTFTGATVNVNPGNTSITCSSCAWNNWSSVNTLLLCTASTLDGQSSDCQNTVYCWPNACSYSGGVLTLDRAYSGPSLTNANWMVGSGPGTYTSSGSWPVGYGQDTFMEGIVGYGFYYAYLACQGTPAGCVTGDDVQAATYLQNVADWYYNYAIVPASGGTAYAAGMPQCIMGGSLPLSIASTNPCRYDGYAVSDKEDYADGSRAILGAYIVGLANSWPNTANYKTMQDNWFAGMWDNGTGSPPAHSVDGYWDYQFDPQGCAITQSWPVFGSGCNAPQPGGTPPNQGYWISSSTLTGSKLVNQMWGVSNQDSWPIARIGGPQAAVTKTVYIDFKLSSVTNATQVKVIIIPPTNDLNDSTNCGATGCTITSSTAPVSVSVNSTLGNYQYRLQYLSSGGSVLAQTDAMRLPIITVQ